MPCVRGISISHALSYFDDDIKKKEAKGFDYYSQEDSGIWVGKTAERLGLTEKPFFREKYHDMMNGKFSYINQKTGEIINIDMAKHSGHKKHQPGIELTLSAPKSLSVMSEVFKDKKVLDAHIKAVNTVLDYIQDNFVYTRSSIDGVIKLEKVDNLIAIKFTHHTNRNHDPQLHTHNLILNIITDKNGKIKTAEFGMIFENERFIRELYNGELAHNLQKLGYEVEWTKKVTQIAPEIKGIPQELLDIFSTRRQEIEEYAKKHGLDLVNPVDMERATLATRPPKDNSVGIDEVSSEWTNKVKNLGIEPDKFKADMFQKNEENLNKLNIDFTDSADFKVSKNSKSFEVSNNLNTLNKLNTLNNLEKQTEQENKRGSLSKAINDSLAHLTERQATFSKEELISNIMARSNGLYGVKAIEKEINKNKELESSYVYTQEYVKHLKNYNSKDKVIFTTKTQIRNEKIIISNITASKGKFNSIYNNVEIDKLINRKINKSSSVKDSLNNLLFGDIEDKAKIENNAYQTLNDSQKHTVEFILKSKDQFIGIQGYAGVGKTYTIKALNEQLKEKGYVLIGLAPTNSATATLCEEANIKTQTLQSFLLKYDGYANDRDGNKEVLEKIKDSFKNKIILVDEASLISNKQMKDLTTIANKLNVRVLLQGDEKQLDSVEAGTPFHRLINDRAINYSELDNILRQKNETVKQAVYDIIGGSMEKSFKKLKETNSVIELRTDKQLNPEENNNYLKDSNMAGIKKDLVNTAVEKYFSYSKEDRSKTLIVTGSNEVRKEINSKIRDNIKTEAIQQKLHENRVDTLKKVQEHGAVAKLTNDFEFKEFKDGNRREILRELKDYFDRVGRDVERDGVSITISNNGLKSSIMHGHCNNKKLQSFKGLKDVIKNGVENNDWVKENRKGLHALVEVEGKNYVVVAQIVKSDDQRLNFYLHDVVEESKIVELLSTQDLTKSLTNSTITDFKEKYFKSQEYIKNVNIETLELKSLTNQEKKEINNYEVGNSVVFTKANTKTGIEKNVEYKILQVYGEKEINTENKEKQVAEEYKSVSEIKVPLKQNEILVADGNKAVVIDITKQANNINIYERLEKELIVGDQIKWTNTDKEKGILKGDSLVVKDIKINETNESNKDIKENTITLLDTKNDKEITLNIDNDNDKNTLKHIDYNYVTTTYSAQGKTSKNVIYTLESYRPNLTTQKDFYVGLSRTKDNVTLITDNINNSIQSLIKNPGEKLGAIDVNNGRSIDKNIDVNNTNNIDSIKSNDVNVGVEKSKSIELELD